MFFLDSLEIPHGLGMVQNHEGHRRFYGKVLVQRKKCYSHRQHFIKQILSGNSVTTKG
jgi:hypothetical protein